MRYIILLIISAMGFSSCASEQPQDKKDPSMAILNVFEVDGKYGYKDTAGNVVIPARYDFAYEFDSNLVAGVSDSTGWVMINKKGETVLTPFIFDNGPDYFEEGLARFVEGGKTGFFDTKGVKVISAQFDFASSFKNGYAVVCNGCSHQALDEEHWSITGGKWGMIDRGGNARIPVMYDAIIHFDADSVTIKEGENWYKMSISTSQKVSIQAPKSQ